MIYDYRPLPPFLTIKESPIDGLGLFATDFIPVGVDYGDKDMLTHVKVVYNNLLIRSVLGGLGNFSSTPNATIDYVTEANGLVFYKMRFLRDIKAGEEITLDYRECAKTMELDFEINFK